MGAAALPPRRLHRAVVAGWLCVDGRGWGARVRRVAAARTSDTPRPARAAARRRALSAHGLALPLRFDHATNRGCPALERGAHAERAAPAPAALRRRNPCPA